MTRAVLSIDKLFCFGSRDDFVWVAVVRVQEGRSAFAICKLRPNLEERANRVIRSHAFRALDAQFRG